MKDLIKFELSVLIEKNKSTNERKLLKKIEILLSWIPSCEKSISFR